MRHIAAITGSSGAGKTTLITGLIRHYVTLGQRVAAIKHTHHELNAQRRGDTGRFLEAGADPVILTNSKGAVVFRDGGEPAWIEHCSPEDLVATIDTDVVLIEGFRSHREWPQVLIEAERRPTVEELGAILDRIWRS